MEKRIVILQGPSPGGLRCWASLPTWPGSWPWSARSDSPGGLAARRLLPACSSLELCPSPAHCDTLQRAPSCPSVWYLVGPGTVPEAMQGSVYVGYNISHWRTAPHSHLVSSPKYQLPHAPPPPPPPEFHAHMRSIDAH